MQAERFDTLSRLIGARTSRRMAVVLAATGLLSIAMPEVAAARCSSSKPCPECKTCRKHRCKPDAAENGNTCTGVSGGTCESGTCCGGLQANCTDAKQCCQNDGKLACETIGNLNQTQCCRPLGGACSTPGGWEECCGIFRSPESGDLIHCAPTNTCGGPGARCHSSSLCASGVCCGFGIEGVCCNAGQFCVNHECVG
jgi:hypothetical protein